jgi:RNA polymerase sigma-70 factor (TIGR02943 family)
MEINHENAKITLENWINQFSDELFSWALYKTSSKETAEDLVQETFLAAFHKINTFQEKSKPKTWLFSILNNKVIDYYRSNNHNSKQTLNISEKSGYELSDGMFDENGNWESNDINAIWDEEQELLDNSEFNNIMQECMEDLPQKWNIAVTSKYLTDKNTEEICEELEITVTNYWQIIHRSKLILKKCLEIKWEK